MGSGTHTLQCIKCRGWGALIGCVYCNDFGRVPDPSSQTAQYGDRVE